MCERVPHDDLRSGTIVPYSYKVDDQASGGVVAIGELKFISEFVQGDDALFHDLAHDVYLTGPLLPRDSTMAAGRRFARHALLAVQMIPYRVHQTVLLRRSTVPKL
jgi:hypothetical protein